MADRCPICDRPQVATPSRSGGAAQAMCFSDDGYCHQAAVDWRARALASEARIDQFRDDIDRLTRALELADLRSFDLEQELHHEARERECAIGELDQALEELGS